MENFLKTFDPRKHHIDSSIASYAGLMYNLVEVYRVKFKAFILNSNSIPLAIEYIKDQINELRFNAGIRDFDRSICANMAKELGINPSNYLQSIINLEEKNNPSSKFIHHIHRENYLSGHYDDMIYTYLKASEVFTGKIGKVENTNIDEQVFDYNFPSYIIKDLLDYVHIKTYLSTLDKLESIIENIELTSNFTTQPKNLQKDKIQIEAYHLGLLVYLYLKQFGIDTLKGSNYIFASYFLILVMGELQHLSKQISYDLKLNEEDKENALNFFKQINTLKTSLFDLQV